MPRLIFWPATRSLEIYFFFHTAQTRSTEKGLQVFKRKRVQNLVVERVNDSALLKQEPYSYIHVYKVSIFIYLYGCTVTSQIVPSVSSLLQQGKRSGMIVS